MLFIDKKFVRKLDGCSGIFLDCLRFFCALLVVAGHCRQVITPALPLTGIFLLGHGAVIVFFVLSGYVIAHTTSAKQRDFKTYIVARYARLYSIYVPALLVTAVCGCVLFRLNQTIFFHYDRGNNLLRYLLTLFFSNEFWFASAAPPLNGPFWSLSFEFWYYTLFAVLLYKLPGRRGIILIILICLLVGPKILLMFPIWVLGWLAYKIKMPSFNIAAARLLSLFFLFLAFTAAAWLPELPGKVGDPPLYMANAYVSDFITGIFIAFSVCCLPTNKESAIRQSAVAKQLRYYANLTYPVYLLHFPILVVGSVILSEYHFTESLNYAIGLIGATSVSMLLGSLFEKYKGLWYNFFNNLVFEKKLAIRPRKIALETNCNL